MSLFNSISKLVILQTLNDKLDQALMALDERSRNIVQSRWLAMDADGNGTKTLHDLAAEYGISAERVRQIETAALKKMRGMLEAEAA